MQKTLVAAAFAAGLGMGGVAFAADLGGLKDGPMVLAPTTGWTGAYIGVGIGGGAAVDDVKADVSQVYRGGHTKSVGKGELDGLGGEGVLGTVQVGYDRQFGRFVGGIFFDYDWTGISGDVKYNGSSLNGKLSASLTSEWSVGGRAGYLVNPETLVYGLAAYTQGNFDLPLHLSGSTPDGYTVGGGIETRLGGNWFLKGEYRYTHFSEETLGTIKVSQGWRNYDVKLTDQTDVQSGRLVLSYKADLFGRDLTPLK
jgi:outer membrane immunogenic protein